MWQLKVVPIGTSFCELCTAQLFRVLYLHYYLYNANTFCTYTLPPTPSIVLTCNLQDLHRQLFKSCKMQGNMLCLIVKNYNPSYRLLAPVTSHLKTRWYIAPTCVLPKQCANTHLSVIPHAL
uniref:Putative secreted protein n=1 Tax=Ixodes ricinus TaxID=34613 RepID=A0A147BAY4_IXORI